MSETREKKPNKRVKYDEAVKTYTQEQMKQHHDDALTYFIEKKGEVSVKVLSRVGKVPQSYIRAWMKEESWLDYTKENPGDKVSLSQTAKEFVHSSVAEKLGLTEQEEEFCYHYFRCKNATQAAIRVGYSPTVSYQVGCQLLKKDRIRQFLTDIRKQVCEELFVDSVDVLRMWAKIAFADMNDYVKVSHGGVMLRSSADGQLVTEVREGRDGITIKLADKMKALDKLSAYLQILPGDKAQDAKLRVLEKALGGTEGESSLKIEIVGV